MCIRLFAILALVLLAAGGCGYHFSGEGDGPKPGLKAIAIPVFENRTSEPDLGALMAGALRQQFMQKGRIQVVPEAQADAVFKGRIIEIHTSAVAHRQAEETIEARLYLTLDIRCLDTKDGSTLWQDPHFSYYKTYIQAVDPIVSFDNRRMALEYLAREMAIRVHDRFLSNF